MKPMFSFLFVVFILSIGIGMFPFSLIIVSHLIKNKNVLTFFFILIRIWVGDSWFDIEYCVSLNGIQNEGPFKVVAEARICDTKLYDYCEAECFTDCPKKYGKKAQGLCNEASQCICRRQC